MSYHLAGDTIAAISTPPGIGAIGVIRISGPDAINIVAGLFPGKDIKLLPPNTLHHGLLQFEGEIIDDVLLSIFRSPHSYTGEDIAEISCHGSPFILRRVMEILSKLGIRPAK